MTPADSGPGTAEAAGSRASLAAAPGTAEAAVRRPLIGILGGMGPAATVDLYAKLVALAGAKRDQDHVRVLIDADPEVPDRQAALAGTGESAGPAIVAKALRLRSAGADVLAIACNAAHAYEAEVVAATNLPFVSLIDAAAQAAMAVAPRGPIGLLATPATLDTRLYERAFEGSCLRLVTPDDLPDGRERLMSLVWRIKGGDAGPAARSEMASIADELASLGARALVAACTEVPLVLGPEDPSVPLIDATDELARRLLEVSAGTVNTALRAE